MPAPNARGGRPPTAPANDDHGRPRRRVTHASTSSVPRVRERPSIAHRDEYDRGGRRARRRRPSTLSTPVGARWKYRGDVSRATGPVARATTAVPRGARRRQSRLPPATDNRSPSPASPPPGRMCTSPVPSSSTRSSTQPSTRAETHVDRASRWLCFSTFDSASAATKYEHSAARFVDRSRHPPRVEPAPGRTRPSPRSRRAGRHRPPARTRRRARSARRGSSPAARTNASGVLRRHDGIECIRGVRRDERARVVRGPRRSRRSHAAPTRAARARDASTLAACCSTSSINRWWSASRRAAASTSACA